MRPVTMTLDDCRAGDALDFRYGHIETLLQARTHLDDIFPDSIHNALLQP